MARGSIPIGQLSGSDAINALHETLKTFNEQANRQTRHLIVLTYVIAGLTAVMLVGLGVQIYLSIP